MKKKVTKKSLKNLKPFKKGNPGGGRPKGSVSLVTILKRTLENKVSLKDPLTKQEESKTISEHLIKRFIAKALSGDMSAIKEVLERIDGKVLQKSEVTTKSHEDALKELE